MNLESPHPRFILENPHLGTFVLKSGLRIPVDIVSASGPKRCRTADQPPQPLRGPREYFSSESFKNRRATACAMAIDIRTLIAGALDV